MYVFQWRHLKEQLHMQLQVRWRHLGRGGGSKLKMSTSCGGSGIYLVPQTLCLGFCIASGIPIINTWDPMISIFGRSTPKNKLFSNQSKGHLGSIGIYYIYINTALRIYCSHDTQSRTAQRISDTMHVWWLHFVAVPHRSHHERGNIGASSWFRSDMWWDCWVHWQAFE